MKRQSSPDDVLKSKAQSGKKQEQNSVTEGAESWYNHHNGLTFNIQIYEHELVIKSPTYSTPENPPPKRKKKDIRRFSKKSRLRVLRKFNQLQTKVLSAPIFITFAAKHKNYSVEKFQRIFLKSFLPRLKETIPNLVYAWRLEPHRDGYPHFHLFAWSWDKMRNLNSQYYRRQVRDDFSESINDFGHSARRYGIKVKGVHNHRKCMQYVSKYMAKEDDLEGSRIAGRRWATSTNFPAVPITEIKMWHEKVHEFKRIAKRLLRAKGGRFESLATQIDGFQDVFLWLDLDEIIWLLREIPGVDPPSELLWYAETGKTTPPESVMDWATAQNDERARAAH